MKRLQLRTRLVGILLATALADGTAFTLASNGSSSPDAEANTANTAARLPRCIPGRTQRLPRVLSKICVCI